MYLKNQNQVKNVQWGTSNQWDIKVEGVPAPFNDWFPALDINISEMSGEHFSITTPSADYDIPKRGGRETITITVIDDQFKTLQTWYDRLNEKIYQSPWGVLPLELSLITINVVHTDTMKETVRHYEYTCLPDGSVNWNGDSNINLSSISLSFKIAKRKVISDNSAEHAKTVNTRQENAISKLSRNLGRVSRGANLVRRFV